MRATVFDTESGIKCTTDGPDSFEWAENNWSCDCNRASCFGQDIGSVCQSNRFLVIDAKFNPGEREYSLNELNSGYPKDVFDKFVRKDSAMSPEKIKEFKTRLESLPKQPPLPKRPLGRFQISTDLFKDWKSLQPIFSQVVVVRAEQLFRLGVIEFEAFCDDFEEVEVGRELPYYSPRMWRNEDGTRTIKGWDMISQ